MKASTTIILLVLSNIFMTLAWYGHLKLKAYPKWANLSLLSIIFLSWGLAFFEYCFQVPANRIGYEGNGGPYSLIQLKVLQEVISLVVFTLMALVIFQNEALRWNHFLAFLCLVAAVYLVFKQ